MPDFHDASRQYRDAQRAHDETDRALTRAREKHGRLGRSLDALARRVRDGDARAGERLEQLRSDADEQRQLVATLAKGLLDRANELSGGFEAFAPFSDPREFVGQKTDTIPMLLFPLRIETRFKLAAIDSAVETDQLWVRIFPDDCLVDTFEEDLSESELSSTKLFWSNYWKAGGGETARRAAWKGLVGSHAAGRAGYLLQRYRPGNEADEPVGVPAEELVLVVATDAPLSDAEKPPVSAYWTAVWRGAGDATALETAATDLEAALGPARAERVAADYAPFNLADETTSGTSRADAALRVVFLEFAPREQQETKLNSWSQAPRTNALPDRFVFIGYRDGEEPLQVIGAPVPATLFLGIDPTAVETDPINTEDGDLALPAQLQWLVDFDVAVGQGMGFRIDLNQVQARSGFDRILVLGLKLSVTAVEGAELVGQLFDHHHYGQNGFGLLPQGTPTNNTESEGSGYTEADDADATYARYVTAADGMSLETDPERKPDGQVLAEALGLDPRHFTDVQNAAAMDQREAMAMNRALWPATLGYVMESLLQPVFSENTIERVRRFFERHVRGRGTVPAIRVGDQPYGILTTAAFSKLTWFRPRSVTRLAADDKDGFMSRLFAVLVEIQAEWDENLLDGVATLTSGKGDAHQRLLDVLGLHGGSVEHHQRYAQSVEEIANKIGLFGLPIAQGITRAYTESGLELLARFGVRPEEVPDLLTKFFFSKQNELKGPLVQDPPSEADALAVVTEDGRNYIEWLVGAARGSHDELRKQDGFTDSVPPNALLYLMLRHALDLSYVEAGLQLHLAAELLTPNEFQAAKLEPAFLHVSSAEPDKQSESKWSYLYKRDGRLTNGQDLVIGRYIPTILGTEPATVVLDRVVSAIEDLNQVPTARLERAFVEHLDLCHYRLDAWKAGVLDYGLSVLRERRGADDTAGGTAGDTAGVADGQDEDVHAQGRGLHVGAFGWLENVRPENKVKSPVRLEGVLDTTFNSGAESPLMLDSTNQGYLLAPSLNHAVTAAVLRNGYLSDASEANPNALKVNLSSARVRKAMGIVEGIRGGQSLSALLGYQLERGLHDGHPGLELDETIYALRKAFPLNADRLQSTRSDAGDDIRTVEARNVVDGLALVTHVEDTEEITYPFGVDLPTTAATALKRAIEAEVSAIRDINDAVADLAIAEGVHQIIQGNYDRTGATLESYSKGHFPPIPDVVQTPRSGAHLTHRFGLHLEAELGNTAPASATPRRVAEPAIDRWVGAVLPDMNQVFCRVRYPDPAGGEVDLALSMQQLGLDPIDLLYTVNMEHDQALASIDELVVLHVQRSAAIRPRPDAEVSVDYRAREGGVALFEVAPAVRSLRALLLRSRPLRASDVMLSNEATRDDPGLLHVEPARILEVANRLSTEATTLETTLVDTIGPLINVPDISVNTSAIIAAIDGWVDAFLDRLAVLQPFGLLQPSAAIVVAGKRAVFRALLEKLSEIVSRWTAELESHDGLVADYDGLPPTATDEQGFAVLQEAERLVSTTYESAATPAALRSALAPKRQAFADRLAELKSVAETTTTSVATLLIEFEALLPLADFDLTEIDLTAEREAFLRYAEDLAGQVSTLHADVQARATEATGLLAGLSALTGQERYDGLSEAAHKLLGDEFLILPEFTVPAEQAAEWQNAYDHRGDLLVYQRTQLGNEFPVDDWMHGLARVREKWQHWENSVFMTEALSGFELGLEPIQLPFTLNDRWLALRYREEGESFPIDADRLLYTAHYAVPFAASRRQCGLLVDEWTEVVPTEEETPGLAFEFDKPNSEPPQSLLLVLPSEFTGAWRWDDLLDALNETLLMARQRAIEPGQIDATDHARFLPATVSSTTAYPITASLNYGLNNRFFELIRETP